MHNLTITDTGNRYVNLYVPIIKKVICNTYIYICDRLQENRAQCGVRKYLEKIDRFLKNVLLAICIGYSKTWRSVMGFTH